MYTFINRFKNKKKDKRMIITLRLSYVSNNNIITMIMYVCVCVCVCARVNILRMILFVAELFANVKHFG